MHLGLARCRSQEAVDDGLRADSLWSHAGDPPDGGVFPGGVEILKACPVADQFRHLFAVIVLGERLTLLAKVGLIKAPQINCHEDKSGAQGIRSRQSIR